MREALTSFARRAREDSIALELEAIDDGPVVDWRREQTMDVERERESKRRKRISITLN